MNRLEVGGFSQEDWEESVRAMEVISRAGDTADDLVYDLVDSKGSADDFLFQMHLLIDEMIENARTLTEAAERRVQKGHGV